MTPSVAFGSDIGPAAARHIEVTFRALLNGPKVRHETAFVEVVTGEPHPLGNFAVVRDSADLSGTRKAIEALVRAAVPSAILFASSPSEDVDAALLASGFENHGEMPAMAARIEELADTRLPEGYTFRQIDRGSLADDWARAFAVGYELPLGIAEVFGPNAVANSTEGTVRYYAALKGDQIVSTSMIHLAEGLAGIYCVATVPEERGKGLGAHMTAEPLRMARSAGFQTGVLQSSEQGHSVYRKLGFADVGGVPLYVRMAN